MTTNPSTGFEKLRELYNEIHKTTTIDQKKQITQRINLYFKNNNYNLKEIQNRLKYMHTTTNDHPENLIELFLTCKDAYQQAIRDVPDPKTQEHMKTLYTFLDQIEQETDELYSEKIPHSITNKNHYRRQLNQTIRPYKPQIRQFIIFTLKDTILLSTKATTDEEPDEAQTENQAEEDLNTNQEETTETQPEDELTKELGNEYDIDELDTNTEDSKDLIA